MNNRFLCIFFLTFIGCQYNKTDPIKSDFVILNLEDHRKYETDEPLIQLESYIVLETTEESLIASVDKLVVKGDSVFILDKKSNSLWLFDTSGKFLTILGSEGGGPGEYDFLQDFFIDKSGNIHLLDLRVPKIMILDNKGVFKEEVKFPYYAFSFCYLENGNYVFEVKDVFGAVEAGHRIVYWNKTEGLVKEYLPNREIFDDPDLMMFANQGLISTNFSKLFYRSMDYSFYSVSEDGLHKSYAIEFGDKAVDLSYFGDEKNINIINDLIFDIAINKKNKIFEVSGYFETDSLLIFRFMLGAEHFIFVHNKKSGVSKLKSFHNLSNEPKVNISPRYAGAEGVYSVISSEELTFLKIGREKEDVKKIIEDSNLEFILDFQDEPNPIIMKYSFIFD